MRTVNTLGLLGMFGENSGWRDEHGEVDGLESAEHLRGDTSNTSLTMLVDSGASRLCLVGQRLYPGLHRLSRDYKELEQPHETSLLDSTSYKASRRVP